MGDTATADSDRTRDTEAFVSQCRRTLLRWRGEQFPGADQHVYTPEPGAALSEHLRFVGRVAEALADLEVAELVEVSRWYQGMTAVGWRVAVRGTHHGDPLCGVERHCDRADPSWAMEAVATQVMACIPNGGDRP